ncbi:MAG TPA: AMP-binding protein, partial [Terriglobales bacterium]|nr:AMP-binding protein [Terriglobales bacterium]
AALLDSDVRISYEDLDTGCAQLAAVLRRQGVRPGDAVLILVPLSIKFYLAVTAVLHLGAIPVLVDPGRGRSHVERCSKLVRPRAFIGSPLSHLLLISSAALRQIPLRFSTSAKIPGSHTLFGSLPTTGVGITPVADDAPALITFTSGSTGVPKAIVRSHGFLLAQHRVLQYSLGHAGDEVVLSALPVFVLSHLAAGLTCVLPDCDLRRPGDIAPDRVIDQLATHAVSAVEAPPALLERIARRCVEKEIRLAVRRFLVGGAPAFPRLMDELASVSPGCEVQNIYGSSEAEPIAQISTSAVSPADICAMKNGRGLLVGRPVPSIGLRVLSQSWGARTRGSTSELERASLPPGEVGEIVVCGDHVLSEYLDAQQLTSKIHVSGVVWHRTGDVGYLDSSGRLWLLGRLETSSNARGNLYPLSVETAMSFCPDVQRSAFFWFKGKRILALQLTSYRIDLRLVDEVLRRASVDSIWEVSHIPTDKRHNSKIDYSGLIGRRHREYKIREVNECAVSQHTDDQATWINLQTVKSPRLGSYAHLRQRVWQSLLNLVPRSLR